MNRPAPRHDHYEAVFTHGSILRHVLVMTATGSIGLMAIFLVDLLSLLYVSWLGDPSLTAAVGYASTVSFFTMAINLGLTIAVTALVARALGAGDRARARRLAASGLVLVALLAAALSLALYPFRRDILALFGARDQTLEVGQRFLAIVLPANLPMALGMALSGVLRAAGDARRAMYITLSGGIVTAFTDPLFIFGFGFGVYGAAIATVISRLVFLAVGYYGAVYVHDLVGRPARGHGLSDTAAMLAIGIPAVLTNLATPVASSVTLRIFSSFGESAVAAYTIFDRIVPVAFGVVFALSGSVGPIIGQNLGARRFDRVRATLTHCFALCTIYVLLTWLVLALLGPTIATLFNAHGESGRLLVFFCRIGALAWPFIGLLFVANAAFNNLGYPLLSTAFNWGRATLGTIPFVSIGAAWYGIEGGVTGIILSSILFGLGALACAYFVTGRLAKTLRSD
jgi:putative MATE family efflux protein